MFYLLEINNTTIPPKLVMRRLFLPCLSIKEDATAVPARISNISHIEVEHNTHNVTSDFSGFIKNVNGKLTKDICRPNKSTCCNIRGNSSTPKHRGRIIYHSIYPSQLLEQEKCCTYANNCTKTYKSGI
jgi:hypothetical protein